MKFGQFRVMQSAGLAPASSVKGDPRFNAPVPPQAPAFASAQIVNGPRSPQLSFTIAAIAHAGKPVE